MYDLDAINSIAESFHDSIIKTEKIEKGYASILHEQILKSINNFDEQLDSEHEVGLKLVSFGQSIQFHVTNIYYKDPYLISFHGFLDDGSPVKLIQHVSQISFLLIKVKRLNPNEPKRPIGFLKQ